MTAAASPQPAGLRVVAPEGLRRILLKFISDFANWDLAATPAYLKATGDPVARATDIHLICRPRPGAASVGCWVDIQHELSTKIVHVHAGMLFQAEGGTTTFWLTAFGLNEKAVPNFFSLRLPWLHSIRQPAQKNDSWTRCSSHPKCR